METLFIYFILGSNVQHPIQLGKYYGKQSKKDPINKFSPTDRARQNVSVDKLNMAWRFVRELDSVALFLLGGIRRQ